jgi:hypothetical protein
MVAIREVDGVESVWRTDRECSEVVGSSPGEQLVRQSRPAVIDDLTPGRLRESARH